jgi:hypothetical protein
MTLRLRRSVHRPTMLIIFFIASRFMFFSLDAKEPKDQGCRKND